MGTTEGRQLANIKDVVGMVEPEFNRLAQLHGAVNFLKEAGFALQLLKNNSYLAGIAASNQDSIKAAILNVAAIGITLNPAMGLAYLVPRGKEVCLDLSYRGMIQLTTDVGSIKWVQSDIVCKNDTFIIRGFGEAPTHERAPFGERGDVVGAYCVALTVDGDYLTTTMSLSEIHAIRDKYSESFKRGKGSGPWVDAEGEMIKKTVIRRAYKTWPKTSPRLEKAIELGFEQEPEAPKERVVIDTADHSIPRVHELLKELGRTEDKFLAHISRIVKREIKALSDLTPIELEQATVWLESLIENEKKKGVS